jgi:hypothetical protein
MRASLTRILKGPLNGCGETMLKYLSAKGHITPSRAAMDPFIGRVETQFRNSV